MGTRRSRGFCFPPGISSLVTGEKYSSNWILPQSLMPYNLERASQERIKEEEELDKTWHGLSGNPNPSFSLVHITSEKFENDGSRLTSVNIHEATS